MAFAAAEFVGAVPVTAGKVFENVHVLTGGTIDVHVQGLGVMASLDANAIWRTVWRAPTEIPGSTSPRLKLGLIAAATSGVARINPAWVAKSADTDINATARSSEGVAPTSRTGGGASDTMQWEAGDNIRVLDAIWTLDATTAPTAGQYILLDIALETASWTLAQVLTMVPLVYWS